jgi:hypothetical protein
MKYQQGLFGYRTQGKHIFLAITMVLWVGCEISPNDFIGEWEFQSGEIIITCLGESTTEDISGEELEIFSSTGPTPLVMNIAEEETCDIDLSVTDHVATSVPGQSCDMPPDETAIDFELINVLFALNDDRRTGSVAILLSGTLNFPDDSTDQCSISSFGTVEKRISP